jgi:hypothetical protein
MNLVHIIISLKSVLILSTYLGLGLSNNTFSSFGFKCNVRFSEHKIDSEEKNFVASLVPPNMHHSHKAESKETQICLFSRERCAVVQCLRVSDAQTC